MTFRFAADADCSVVDTQHFPGVQRQLAMGFATPRKKDAEEQQQKQELLSDSDPCKVGVYHHRNKYDIEIHIHKYIDK